uniref:Uncharacterized protein n=1 Tax=Setaria italica TaxID=4555 RepID=K4AI11_SETIT
MAFRRDRHTGSVQGRWKACSPDRVGERGRRRRHHLADTGRRGGRAASAG